MNSASVSLTGGVKVFVAPKALSESRRSQVRSSLTHISQTNAFPELDRPILHRPDIRI